MIISTQLTENNIKNFEKFKLFCKERNITIEVAINSLIAREILLYDQLHGTESSY